MVLVFLALLLLNINPGAFTGPRVALTPEAAFDDSIERPVAILVANNTKSDAAMSVLAGSGWQPVSEGLDVCSDAFPPVAQNVSDYLSSHPTIRTRPAAFAMGFIPLELAPLLPLLPPLPPLPSPAPPLPPC